ncbi:MAG: 4-hydroxythreonine-4-phosphate dehydrogenase PdxA [Aeromonadales bacterium]|nr:4-hydroxythreonine-4-phosphate dehydrogenase PdxA [Aeromonadales bacterium]
MKNRLAITPGEPSGVGPELMYYVSTLDLEDTQLVIIASKELIRQRVALFDNNVIIKDYDKDNFEPQKKGTLTVLDVPLPVPSVPGTLDKRNAKYVLDCLDIASDKSESGEFLGIVTGPISKAVIADTGLNFTGHTEYFQERTNTKRVVMMLGCDEMNVALATTHLPLKDVSEHITKELLIEIVTILNHDLKTKFGIKEPCIISAGLNPHSGEDGHLGREELDTIIPTFNLLREQGINIIGPLPADTMFQKKFIDKADAFLTMYHDQGLPVLKYVGFDSGYNTTLGLPYIRTSVDHGTALDLAGKKLADSGSLFSAIKLACRMIASRS